MDAGDLADAALGAAGVAGAGFTGSDPEVCLATALAELAEGGDVPLAAGFQGELPPTGEYELLDRMARRNVVIASWRRSSDGVTGTWAVTFDRVGRVVAWTSAK